MKLRLVTRRAVGCGLTALAFCCCQQLSLPGQEIDSASARAYNAAAALQNAGLYARAASRWSEFISQYPSDNRIGRANYFLGVCRLREKKYAESAELFRVVLSRWPDLQQADKAQYNLAMSRYAIAGEANEAAGFQETARDFERVVSQYPDSDLVDDSLYYRGDCLFNAGQLEDALLVYQNLISKHPTSTHAARTHYDMGVAQQELNRMAEAVKTFQAFLDRPEFETHELASEIRLRLAICLHASGDLDRAAEQFGTVSKIPDYELASFAAFRLGQTMQEQQKYVEAAKLLNDFPKKFPKSDYQADAMKTAGHCYYLANLPQDAVRVLVPVAKSNDRAAAEAAYWLGRAQLKLNQADQALQTFDSAIHRFGSDPFESYLQFARIDALYEIPKRRPETPKLYESFLREHPDHALASQAAYMAALASFGQQDFRKARELAEAYLAKPEHAELLVVGDLKYIAAESYLLESPGNGDARTKALTLYRELVTKFPTHSRAARSHLRIGWCLQAEQKPQEAIKHLRSVLSKLDRQQHLPEALLLVGRCHSELNANREAITAFNEAIAANSKWGRIDEVLLGLADSYRALGELDPAVDQLRRLADTQPNSELRPQACYWLGEIAQQRERYDEAGAWFKQVTDQYADSEFAGPAMHALAAVHLVKKEYPQTRQWATRLIDSTAGDTLKQRARYLRGLACHRENQCGKAIEDLKAYVHDPVEEDEATSAAYTLALCQIAEKQYDAAGDVLGKLLKAATEFPQADKAYYELGHGFRSEDKSARAADAFQWIADNRPESDLCPESWFRVAQSHAEVAAKADDQRRNASYTAAETALANGLAKAKDSPIRESMQYLMGQLQFQQQRFADAARTLTTQIGEFPDGQYVGSATFLAAQSHEQLQQYDLALPLFAKITDLPFSDTPDDRLRSYHAQALYYAGDCAAKLERWKESQTHFQKLADQHPTFPKLAEARYGVGFAVQQQGELDSALEIYEQVTQQTETETAAKARFMIGEIEFGRKKFEDAIEHFLLVTVGYPYESWQALARLETARCFLELGDEERAVRTLREMIEKHPQHTRAIDAKKMLEDLMK